MFNFWVGNHLVAPCASNVSPDVKWVAVMSVLANEISGENILSLRYRLSKSLSGG